MSDIVLDSLHLFFLIVPTALKHDLNMFYCKWGNWSEKDDSEDYEAVVGAAGA